MRRFSVPLYMALPVQAVSVALARPIGKWMYCTQWPEPELGQVVSWLVLKSALGLGAPLTS